MGHACHPGVDECKDPVLLHTDSGPIKPPLLAHVVVFLYMRIGPSTYIQAVSPASRPLLPPSSNLSKTFRG